MGATIHLVPTLTFQAPPTAPADVLDAAFDEAIEPLVGSIEGDSRVRATLHLGGRLLEHAAGHRPDFIDRLRRAVQREQIELLGGGFHDPVLASIPERDAIGQLLFAANFHQRLFGKVPRGAWLALRAWDPALPRTLSGADVRYALLDDAHFVVAGLAPDDVHGHFVTDREGRALGLFPIDAALSNAWLGSADALGAALDAMAERHDGGERLEAIAGDGFALWQGGGWERLRKLLHDEGHWVKSTTPDRAAAQFPSEGRVYLPTAADPALGDWSRPASAAHRRRAFAERMQAASVWGEVEHFVAGVVWDNFLVKYPEANRLHKRMLRVSERVESFRQLLHERQRQGLAGPSDAKARKVLERACDGLWRGQSQAAYWHGGRAHAGIYDGDLRRAITRSLIAAERLVDKAVGDPAKDGWLAETGDLDADGRNEVVATTPTLRAVVHPGEGGGLWEIDLRESALPLQTAFIGSEEPYDVGLVGDEVALVSDDETTDTGLPAVAEPDLAARHVPHVSTGAFLDRFLGPETTLETFARRHFRELGDFATGPWELVKTAAPDDDGFGSVAVGRSGVVRDVDRGLLLRVEKTYRLDQAHPRMQLRHSIANRSRDPARFRHGIEWTAGVPSGAAESVQLRVFGDKDAEERVARLGDGPFDGGLATWVEWADEASALRIVIEPDRPMRVWWAPVRTAYPTASGWRDEIQGHTLLLCDDVELWGDETRDLSLRIDFVSG